MRGYADPRGLEDDVSTKHGVCVNQPEVAGAPQGFEANRGLDTALFSIAN
jgi:hypothetical protein